MVEAWEFLLRKELKLRPTEPNWLDLPAMMQMVVTTPNILKHRRREWLGPFNFFLFPIVSILGGYPAGFDKSNFLFITPYESDRKKWESLAGVNLFDGQSFRITMQPTVTAFRRELVILPRAQGEDPSMIDFQNHLFETQGKMVVASPEETRRWKKVARRQLICATRLSQKAVYAIISGQPVRPNTLERFRLGVADV